MYECPTTQPMSEVAHQTSSFSSANIQSAIAATQTA